MTKPISNVWLCGQAENKRALLCFFSLDLPNFMQDIPLAIAVCESRGKFLNASNLHGDLRAGRGRREGRHYR
jgi:hypothetical protein